MPAITSSPSRAQPARNLGISDVRTFGRAGEAALTVLTADHREMDLSYSHLLP